MNKFFFTYFLLLATAIMARAQSLERQVIGTAGSFQNVSWGSLSYTTGEVAVTTLTTATNVLTQGFQQPLQNDVMVYGIGINQLSVVAYPNPAADIINVVINANNADDRYSVTFFDLPGHRLDIPYKELSQGTTTHLLFDLRRLAAATYMIMITDQHNIKVKAIKFSKND